MTVRDILSQDEVDALFQGMNEGDVNTEPEPVVEESSIRPYDLANQDRIVRGRMPTLEVINERFARLWRVNLFNFLRRSAEISIGQVRLLKYSEFVRALMVPSNINIVQLKPLRGHALFILDPRLVFAVIDNYFGGDGRFHARIEGREFTPLEMRIIHRLLNMALKDYQLAWQPVIDLQAELLRSEVNPQFVNIATPTEVVILTDFTVELESGVGTLQICMPYGMVEPVRDQLTAGTMADRSEVDKRWIAALGEEVREAEVELQVEFLRTQLSVGQILALRDGDVIPVQMPERLLVRSAGVPLFSARYGVHDEHYAIEFQAPANPETVPGQDAMAEWEK